MVKSCQLSKVRDVKWIAKVYHGIQLWFHKSIHGLVKIKYT